MKVLKGLFLVRAYLDGYDLFSKEISCHIKHGKRNLKQISALEEGLELKKFSYAFNSIVVSYWGMLNPNKEYHRLWFSSKTKLPIFLVQVSYYTGYSNLCIRPVVPQQIGIEPAEITAKHFFVVKTAKNITWMSYMVLDASMPACSKNTFCSSSRFDLYPAHP